MMDLAGTQVGIARSSLVDLVKLLTKLDADQLIVLDNTVYVPTPSVIITGDISPVLSDVSKDMDDTGSEKPEVSFQLPGYDDLLVYEGVDAPIVTLEFVDSDTVRFYAEPVEVMLRLSELDEDTYRSDMEHLLQYKPVLRYTVPESVYKLLNKVKNLGENIILTPEGIRAYKFKTNMINVQGVEFEVLDEQYKETSCFSVTPDYIKLNPNVIEFAKLGDENLVVYHVPLTGLDIRLISLTTENPVSTEQIEQLLYE